jgi:hypothetical protein
MMHWRKGGHGGVWGGAGSCHDQPCALSDILATSPDNLAKNGVKMAIESRRRHFYAFEFYKIWHLYI